MRIGARFEVAEKLILLILSPVTLRNRIYLSMGLIVLTSFLIIGAITVWYTSYENEKYLEFSASKFNSEENDFNSVYFLIFSEFFIIIFYLDIGFFLLFS